MLCYTAVSPQVGGVPEVMPDSMIKYARPDPAHIVEALQVSHPPLVSGHIGS